MGERVAVAPSGARLTVRPLSGALGAEVSGVDLSRPLDDALFAEVRQAFHDNIVVVFPGQRITPAQQVAFTGRFGPVEAHPLGSRRGAEGHPQVLVLENRKGRKGARNDFWHSDISFAERPPLGSVLYALEVPEGRGDTMFCNMYDAYEGLSERLKGVLEGLSAMHHADALVQRNKAADSDAMTIAEAPPGVEHPVVRTHPETGRKALYVNPYFTTRFADMTEEESRPLLEFLHARATRPENVYRHRWRPFDLVMWDNRCAMHYAIYDYDETVPRLMHRTTATGERPV